jgi:hypothetical protein
MAMLDAGCQLALGAHATRGDDGRSRSTPGTRARAPAAEHASAEGAAALAFEALGRPRRAA